MFAAEVLNLAGDMGGGATAAGPWGAVIGGFANTGFKIYNSRKSRENFEVVRQLDAHEAEIAHSKTIGKLDIKNSELRELYKGDPEKQRIIDGITQLNKWSAERANLITYRNNEAAYNKDWNWWSGYDLMSSVITGGRGDLAQFTKARQTKLQQVNAKILNFKWGRKNGEINNWSVSGGKIHGNLIGASSDAMIGNKLVHHKSQLGDFYAESLRKLRIKQRKATAGDLPEIVGAEAYVSQFAPHLSYDNLLSSGKIKGGEWKDQNNELYEHVFDLNALRKSLTKSRLIKLIKKRNIIWV